jgi:peptide-methionine (S)-S-oxide reductase
VFWQEHDPCSPQRSTQYRAILFYDGEAQRAAAEASLRDVAKSFTHQVQTELRPAGVFYRAEDYHQKYTLRRHHRLTADLKRLYPTEREFEDATAVARVHAYVDGHLDLPALRRELAMLGLRAVGKNRLQGIERAADEPRGSKETERGSRR